MGNCPYCGNSQFDNSEGGKPENCCQNSLDLLRQYRDSAKVRLQRAIDAQSKEFVNVRKYEKAIEELERRIAEK